MSLNASVSKVTGQKCIVYSIPAWGSIFFVITSRLSGEPNQLPTQWVPGDISRGKVSKAWIWTLTSSWCRDLMHGVTPPRLLHASMAWWLGMGVTVYLLPTRH